MLNILHDNAPPESGLFKVLIVDDSRVIRESLFRLISEIQDVEIVGEANNATLAVHAIRNLRPDAVILDLHMPGPPNFDFLSHMGLYVISQTEQDDERPSFIILTNYPYTEYRERCLALGIRFFFDKYGDFEKVPEALKQLIQEKRAAIGKCEKVTAKK